MTKENGYEISPLKPGWIKKKMSNTYFDDDFKRMMIFYVINTPCVELSFSGIALSEYGWGKDIWGNYDWKNYLFGIADLKRGSTFAVAHKTEQMKEVCEKISMKKDFHRCRDRERIVIYKSRQNEFSSIFHHIRNAFAHGRMAVYECEDGSDLIFVLEDGKKSKEQFEVRARMVLKKSTLMKWMEIIQSGKYPNEVELKRKHPKKKSKAKQEEK